MLCKWGPYHFIATTLGGWQAWVSRKYSFWSKHNEKDAWSGWDRLYTLAREAHCLVLITWIKPDLICSSLQLVVERLCLLEVALNVLHVPKWLELLHLLGIALQLLCETLPTQLHIRSIIDLPGLFQTSNPIQWHSNPAVMYAYVYLLWNRSPLLFLEQIFRKPTDRLLLIIFPSPMLKEHA